MVYIAFGCGTAFAGPNLASVADQLRQSGCLAPAQQASASSSAASAAQQEHPYLNAGVEIVGIALVAAAVLGAAYLGYRAANRPVNCTTMELNTQGTMWTTTCR